MITVLYAILINVVTLVTWYLLYRGGAMGLVIGT